MPSSEIIHAVLLLDIHLEGNMSVSQKSSHLPEK
jgi:hypothetical protein